MSFIPIICISLITSEGNNVYIVFILLSELSSCFLPIASPPMSQMKIIQSGECKWPVQGHIASYWKGQSQNSFFGFPLTPPPCCPGLSSQQPHLPPYPATSEGGTWNPFIPGIVQGKERTGQAAPWRMQPDMKSSLQKALEFLLMNSRQPLKHTVK